MYQLISLSRLLSHSRNAKGLPPDDIVSSGVACLSPATMQRQGWNVLHLLLISYQLPSSESHKTVAYAWPLDVLDQQYVALDDASLATITCVPHNLPFNLPTLQSPQRKQTKTKKKKNKSTSTNHSPTSAHHQSTTLNHVSQSNNATTPHYLVDLRLLSYIDQVETAVTVRMSSSLDIQFIGSAQVTSMVSAILVGRPLLVGMLLPVSILGKHISFTVVSIDDDGDPHNIPHSPKRVDTYTNLIIEPHNALTTDIHHTSYASLNSVAGLKSQVQKLRNLADAALLCKSVKPPISSVYNTPRGLLLYGPPGTGKTMLACALSEVYSANLEVICGPELLAQYSGEAVRSLENTFSRARRKRPSIIVLDEVDAIAPCRDAPDSENVQRKCTAALLAILDSHNGHSLDGMFIIGTTNKSHAIDPAMRRAGRFDLEIEITSPDVHARLEILRSLVDKAQKEDTLDITNEELEKIATLCYGFVGADLVALWRESVRIALQRNEKLIVTANDMRQALKRIRPSALREITVEISSTKWDDIGGKEEVKQRLKEAVEWPLTKAGAALFQSVGVVPPKGVLLYGPPGCSKTLLARAVATECGANFIAIKGAELLSKWVGESEKAVRNIFRRARQAAPCVVFFDEVDALASSRSTTGGASAQARVVAQLLCELDGVDRTEDGERVVVIAATNRPDCLDAAFLRPGRMDVQIYVGLPDVEERLRIFQVHTRCVPLSDDVDLQSLANDDCTGGFSGAEVAALVREAGLVAMGRDVEAACMVTGADFAEARLRVTARTPRSLMEYFEKYRES